MRKISIIFILTINFIFAQNQQIQIEYSLKFNKKTNSKPSELIKALENEKFILIASETESLFLGIEKLNNEVTKAEKLASIVSGSNDIFYSNNKYILIQKDVSGSKLLIEKEKNFINWSLTKENKLIGKYLCYKATGKISQINYKNEQIESQIIAWYSPQINYSVGPMGYNGLTGAILELQIAKKNYYATKVIIRKENTQKIEKPTKGKRMTEKEFEEFGKQLYQDRKKN